MAEPERHVEELLLDLHLDRLGPEDQTWIEAELDKDAALRSKSDYLGKILCPLDACTVPTAHDDLGDAVMARIAREVAPSWASAAPTETKRRLRLPFKLREAIAVAACVGLLATVGVPALGKLRDRTHRARCASNLGSVFQGVTLYRAAFAGSLPFAGAASNASWLPRGARLYASNSRHSFLLAKHNFGPKPADFICPASDGGVAMPADSLAGRDDFAASRNNTYDSLNLSGEQPNLTPKAIIAYMSDRNPLFRRGGFDDSINPATANSPAHKGRGQTVLTLDGTARWMTSPIYGAARDNLWLVRNVLQYTGTEAPTRDDDSQLVPGYPTTDPQLRALLKR